MGKDSGKNKASEFKGQVRSKKGFSEAKMKVAIERLKKALEKDSGPMVTEDTPLLKIPKRKDEFVVLFIPKKKKGKRRTE